MRSSMKQNMHKYNDPIFCMNYHDFLHAEGHKTKMELATEFGLSLHDVQTLKKSLTRN